MELVLEADRVDWVDGAAVASGHVRAVWGENVVTGENAVFSDDVVHVVSGEWTRPGATIAFSSADVALAGGSRAVDVRARVGEASLEADTVEVGETWVATGADLAPCACTDGGRPAITFRASEITVVPDRYAVVRGGTVRVFDLPVLPVPYWRVPLNPRRFRLDVPQVAHGEYGWAAAIDARGGVGDWTISGGPRWREDRGFRAEVGAAGPVGSARGEGGWDAVDARPRGLLTSSGGTTAVRTGWDVQLASDADYVEDYAVDYVTRGLDWRESRGVLATDVFRADGWWADDGSVATNARMRVRPELGRMGPVAVAPRVEWAGIVGEDGVVPRGLAGVDARASGTAGMLHAEGRLDASAFSYGQGDGGVGAAGEGRVELPFWSEAGKARVQWWPGVRGTLGVREGTGPLPEDLDARAWFAGPSLRAQSVVGDVIVGVDGAVGYTEDGWRPEGALDVAGSVLSARVQADPDVQAGTVAATAGPVSASVGTAHADALWLGWGDAGVTIGRFVTGGGLSWDLAGAEYAGATARAGYDDGCVSAMVTAALSPDRELPDVGFAMRVRR